MYKFYVNNDFKIIYKEDFPSLVEEYMGKDVGEIVKELIKNSNYNDYKLNSDIISYESQIEEWYSLVCEIEVTANKLLDYINTAKRINRNKIKDFIEDINNYIKQIL